MTTRYIQNPHADAEQQSSKPQNRTQCAAYRFAREGALSPRRQRHIPVRHACDDWKSECTVSTHCCRLHHSDSLAQVTKRWCLCTSRACRDEMLFSQQNAAGRTQNFKSCAGALLVAREARGQLLLLLQRHRRDVVARLGDALAALLRCKAAMIDDCADGSQERF